MTQDVRGWRMALLADALLNPPAAERSLLPDVLTVLEAASYGLLQLPPAVGEHRLLLAVIADQVAEYALHGYAVAAVGLKGLAGDGLHWRRLAPLLRHRGVTLPPRHIIRPQTDAAAEGRRLAEFLAGYDLSPEAQRRWRLPTRGEK